MIRLRRIPPNRVESTPLESGLPPNVPPNVPPNAIQLADGGYAVLEEGGRREKRIGRDGCGEVFVIEIDHWEPIEVVDE